MHHAWELFRAELARTYKENPLTPLPGVEDMLKALHDKGIKVGLTTGFAREIVDIIVSAMGWDNGIIDTVVAGDEVEHGRPEPDQILAVMEKLGVTDKSAVISSGDTEADVRSAQAAGITSVGVLTGHLTREQFEALDVDHILDSSANLLDIVGK
ncbi:HAD hydrolase-like protein [Corynebacterium sp. HMSC074C05]|uniref:HAD hydrolase-like protein n=1 Tax=Corynebacterium sp. HMSC074C05 TaxID=1739534 RepID=UPI000AF8E155|nr:HAD hydrolase-like protein [Corynebacterium sp. HMSC074C05]